MTMRYYFSIALFFCVSLAFSQDFTKDYSPLKNKGVLPVDLLSSSTQKYRQRKKSISKADSRKTKKAKSNFYLESSFVIDELLHSGKILFSDPEITGYISSVADDLLKDQPSLRRKLRFYTIKSSSVNAFATDRGAIFFTLGLLSKLNTEAELAFVLSHEIAHFTEKHSINSAVTFDKINRKGRRRVTFNNSKSYDPLLKKSNYSKANELEADVLGAKRFLKTAYQPEAMLDVFDILEYAHVPLNNDTVSTTFLNLEGLTIPKKYFLTTIDDPEPMPDDEYSTHPGIDTRRNKAEILLDKSSRKKGKDFIVSEKRFKLAKTMAQFELCDVLLHEIQYPMAIYYSSILLNKYPENRFLRRVKAYALYGIAQYTNTDRQVDVVDDYQDVEGNSRQVFRVLDRISTNPANINLVASRYCWDYNQAYPDDKGMELAMHDQIEDLVIYGLEEPEGFFSSYKFKRAKPEKDYGLLAFAKIVDDKSFQKMLKDGARYRKKKDEEESRSKKKRKKKKIALGLKKAIFINPVYYRVNIKRRSNDELKYIYSESRQGELAQIIKDNAKRVGLKAKVIDSHRFKSKRATEDFNDLILLKSFEEELLTHNMYMIASSYNQVQPLVKKYGTSALVSMGNISARKRPSVMSYPMSMVFLLPPFTSSGIKRMFFNYQGLQYAFVVDLEDSQILYKEVVPYNQKDIKPLLEMNTYNLLYKMAARKKKSNKR